MATLRIGDLEIRGGSQAGVESWFRVRPPGLALDVGRGPMELVGVEHLFLSHGHLDHASGLPLLLSHRSVQDLAPASVYCPAAIEGAVDRFLRAAAALEGERYRYRLMPLSPGDRVELAGGCAVEAFAVHHPVPALGYHLWRAKRRLAEPFRGLAGEEIRRLRDGGAEVSETVEELWLSYSGDSGPELLESEPRLFEARVLLLECTFLGPGAAERGRRFGHLHVDDLVRHRRSFRNEALVLHHLSRRHRPRELWREVQLRLPELAERVRVMAADGAWVPDGAAGSV